MSLPDGLALRVAGPDDLPAIVELRLAAGWGVQEWALRLAIEPANARCFVVADAAGDILAVGSGVSYAPLGVVGNMIVAEGHRRRGIGGAVLEAVLGYLEGAGCTRLELYATEVGRPLYSRHGFGFIQPGSHARLPRGLALEEAGDGLVVDAADAAILHALTDYDAPRFGGPRRPLLEVMLRDPDRPVLVARRGHRIVGFAWLRSDGDRIGPWVADDPAVAAAILAEAFRRLPRHEALTTNIPMSNQPGVAWLRGLGVEPDPWDGRMARGPEIARRDETIYSNALGALG